MGQSAVPSARRFPETATLLRRFSSFTILQALSLLDISMSFIPISAPTRNFTGFWVPPRGAVTSNSGKTVSPFYQGKVNNM
jgi:hypothetical protein